MPTGENGCGPTIQHGGWRSGHTGKVINPNEEPIGSNLVDQYFQRVDGGPLVGMVPAGQVLNSIPSVAHYRRVIAGIEGVKPDSIRYCGLPIPEKRAAHVELGRRWESVEVVAGGRGVRYRGLQACGNSLVCPSCSWWRRMALVDRWESVIQEGRARGLYPAMVVLTVRHEAGEDLGPVLSDLKRAWREYRQMSSGRWFLNGVGPVWACALDVVLGGPNGAHPHYNVLTLRPGAEVLGVKAADRRIEAEIIEGWDRALVRVAGGRRSVEKGIGVRVSLVEPGEDRSATAYAVKSLDPTTAAFEALENRWRSGIRLGGITLQQLVVLCGVWEGAWPWMVGASEALFGVRAFSESREWRKMASDIEAVDVDDGADPVEVVDGDAVTVAWVWGSDWFKWRDWVERNGGLPAEAWLAKAERDGVPHRRA